MKKTIFWLLKAFVAGISAIAVLSIFCLFYSYEGVHLTSKSGATDYIWESHQQKSTMKEGFSWLKMDANGFNNIYEYSQNPDILLMGSSHMEALQVKPTENTGALLNSLLPNLKTYNIGTSGHTIYRCVDNLEPAIIEYQPRRYVVMVIDTIDLLSEEMIKVVDDTATAIPSYDGGAMYYVQKIPAVKAVYKQLSDWISLDTQMANLQEEDRETYGPITNKTEDFDVILNSFLGKAADIVKKEHLSLIMVYQPKQFLCSDGTIDYEHSEEILQQFSKACEKQGIIFCDMTEEFNQLYKEDKELAHGFINSELGEGHLNKHGHAVIADAVAKQINKLEGDI